MKIVDKPIEWLRPYENNPRNNEQAVEAVANSIKERFRLSQRLTEKS